MKKKYLIGFVWENLYILILIGLFGFLFFYRLDWQTLGSWDEAWYGSIAREIVKSGDFIHLNWNGKPFYDHPPMGFWIMALTYKLFGITEFTTRFPSAVAGVGSIILMYFVSLRYFKLKHVAFASSLILGTTVWYVLRVRSGNLDSLFVFFYLSSLHLALLARKNFSWFPVMSLSFATLMLTKTLVGISAAPVLFIIIFPELIKIRKNFKLIIGGILSFSLLFLPWYYIHYITYSDFLQHHVFEIGTRNKTFASYFKLNYELPLFYLHMGVRKWYYLWIISLGYLTVLFPFAKKKYAWLLILNATILYPFLTTDQTHIWHLIPMYIPLALTVSYGLWHMGTHGTWLLSRIFVGKHIWIRAGKNTLTNRYVLGVIYVAFVFFIAVWQAKIFYHEVIPGSKYIPDDVDISMKAGTYHGTLYLDDDYLPLAVFYSNRFMKQMAYEPDERKTLVKLFQNENEPFVAITRSWALTNLKEAGLDFRVLESNKSFSIVSKP